MRDTNNVAGKITVGLDLGDKHSHLLVLSHDGEVLEDGRIVTTAKGFRSRFSNLEPAVVAIEAGTHSPWVSRLLEECGHEVLVANPRKLRLIYENNTKSDKVDAEYLARLARVDRKLLGPIQHRSEEAQKDLALLRLRDGLVGARTKIVNAVRSTVKSIGGRLPSCGADSFHHKVVEAIPESLKEAVSPALAALKELTARIAECDKKIEALCDGSYAKETQKLRQIKGVGPLTSLAFVLTVWDPRRFKKSRDVGAYLGLVPRRQESGEQQPQLRITKAGDKLLRRLLVTSAHYVLGPFGEDCDLRRFGEAIAQRGGKNAKKRAVVAVARKLAVLLHRLWLSDKTYEPLRQGKRSRQQKTPQGVAKS